MSFSASAVTPSSTHTTHVPTASLPRRPARPLIWMYSPLVSARCAVPSNFAVDANTHVRAGMFRPIANVSVAKRAFTSWAWNRTSTSSFTRGRRPEWCTAMPRRRRARMCSRGGRARSSSGSSATALSNTCAVAVFCFRCVWIYLRFGFFGGGCLVVVWPFGVLVVVSV